MRCRHAHRLGQVAHLSTRRAQPRRHRLVISPLVALMKDQIDSLIKRNIAATFINSSLSTAEQNKRLQSFANGEYKVILVAPERLRQQTFREVLAQTKISLLAIDEAHCLSQWGRFSSRLFAHRPRPPST